MNARLGPEQSLVFSLFKELAGINSESGHEGGVARFIKSFFDKLGLPAIEDNTGKATGGECGNILIKVPGRGSSVDPVIFCSHMDTVKPGNGIVVLEQEDRFCSKSETILGVDDKAGVAAMMAAANILIESEQNYRPLELLFTVQEEIGLIGSKNLDRGMLRGKWGIVLDGEGAVGGIVVRAPSQDKWKFKIHGRSAHAGIEPEKGVNAILCAAKAVAGLKSGRIDDITTVNIGMIEGGTATNIVPELVMVEGEIRSFDEKRLRKEKEIIIESFEKAALDTDCRLDVEVERAFHGFELDRGSVPVVQISQAIEEAGYEPRFLSSGGGSDTNVLNRMGLEMVTGSIGLENPHSKEEFILKDELLGIVGILIKMATMKI